MRKPRQPDPDVHESDYRVPAAIGTLAWTAALVLLLAMDEGLPESEQWWIGVCLTGIALGVFGFLYIPRLLRSRGEGPEQTGDTEGTGAGTGGAAHRAPRDTTAGTGEDTAPGRP
ncbi:DUF2530 domain-containing protein [Nocardiopsis xinjiangensis]|uniref:DUF2530 domain-containing protein n=1 Tax=Nocardiopsis xinjiangensis TaxID=124285 RepID=UPI00036E042E|nr:DUF2530 domain-containing protein [Nocardiopsis xinjiangensis]